MRPIPVGRRSNPFENAFHAKATPLQTEKQARAQLNLRDGPHLEDRQPRGEERGRRAGRLQVPAGRQLVPVRLAECLVAEAGRLRRTPRLGHAVSTRARSTRAGDYPNQSRGGDGLIRWTEQDRPIADTDVVLWYTFGHTHIPRPEDYPVMPTAYIGFLLKPAGFFDLNPANDVPPSPQKTEGSEGHGCCGTGS